MKRILAILAAALILALPVATMADYNINIQCTIELHVTERNPVMKFLTDNTYSSTVPFVQDDYFSVKWTDKTEVAAIYWEWLTIPTRALVECISETGECVYEREYENVIRFITVFPAEEVRATPMPMPTSSRPPTSV